MARIVPSGWEALEVAGAALREIETLRYLAATLPASFTVYHGVHWTRVHDGYAAIGDADFIVVDGAGRALVIEQKSGMLSEGEDGASHTPSLRLTSVAVELARTIAHLTERIRAATRDNTFVVEGIVYCPDYTVRSPGSVGVDASRVVDAARRHQLSGVIQGVMVAIDAPLHGVARLHRFLSDELGLVADASAIMGGAGALVTRLAGGLATWARRLDISPHRLRVVGTAGSGKTQLAIAVINDALASAKRVLYVCYNRPLADHIARIAAQGAEIATYHQLCDRVVRDQGLVPDFTVAEPFERLESQFADAAVSQRWTFDVVIVDEGQDFEARWVEPLLSCLRQPGAFWWLEDPMQNLYLREPVALPGWTVLRANANYRSPRDILHILNALPGTREPIEAASPFGGSSVELTMYEADTVPVEETKRAITHALALGFRREDIVVLSFHGRERSAFSQLERIGPHSLRAFDGRYDLFGNPEYRDGEVLFESIYRFKGQAAPCVIFTEIDFATLDDRAVRKFLVGATRATMKLILIATERSAKELKLPTLTLD